MSAGLVSIIMPCRNGEKTIRESIHSVLSQTYTNFELLVIDDGSSDETINIVETLAQTDNRIRLIRNPMPGQGVGKVRNVGLQRAQGNFITFLDCDDVWFPWSIQHRINFMLNTGADITYGSYLRLCPGGRIQTIFAKRKLSFQDMLRTNHIGNLTGMYSADLLGVEFQESIGHEDYLMWLRLMQRAKNVGCDPSIHLGFYRVHANSVSSKKLTAFTWHWKILRKKIKLSWLKAAYCQGWYTFSSIINRIKV